MSAARPAFCSISPAVGHPRSRPGWLPWSSVTSFCTGWWASPTSSARRLPVSRRSSNAARSCSPVCSQRGRPSVCSSARSCQNSSLSASTFLYSVVTRFRMTVVAMSWILSFLGVSLYLRPGRDERCQRVRLDDGRAVQVEPLDRVREPPLGPVRLDLVDLVGERGSERGTGNDRVPWDLVGCWAGGRRGGNVVRHHDAEARRTANEAVQQRLPCGRRSRVVVDEPVVLAEVPLEPRRNDDEPVVPGDIRLVE